MASAILMSRGLNSFQKPRRTKAEQEVLALIAPLGKLGRFEEVVDFFQANA